MQFLSKLNRIFSPRERWQLAILSIALIVRAFVELLGVASIAPFMAMVADRGEIVRNPWLRWVRDQFSFASDDSFLFSTGVVVIALLVACNAYSALTQWALLKFSWNTNHRLSMRLLEGYLSQPYGYFTQVNSANLSNSILSEVQQVINGVLIPLLTAVSRFLVALALVGLLIYVDPLMALMIVAVLGGSYGFLYLMIRNRQIRLGVQRSLANKTRFRVASEAFGGIKDVKVLGREQAFLDRFRPASWDYSSSTASNTIAGQLPRYLFEAIAFGGMILIVLYFLSAGRNIATILPQLSLYALAGYRLMPELQQLFSSMSTMRFNFAALDSLLSDVQRFPPKRTEKKSLPMKFDASIEIQDVSFVYPNVDSHALKGVSLSIAKNSTVGFVGKSGAGKTTLVDLILGLYTPTAGRILIDGVPMVADNLEHWQQMIGYVPQQIFLCDDTIAANIAFGVPQQDISLDRIATALRLAHLDEFVASLREGIQTIVGERGVRLSGGQRQRIGIARALYHNPAVLVMDEATSALDGETENAVMDAINELTGKKTILIVAHRMTTVQRCDEIYMLQTGELFAHGTFDTLANSMSEFRALAGVGVD